MAQIEFNGAQVLARDDETVLEALLRGGVDVPFSCKGGSCLTCMLQCTQGDVGTDSQQGLSDDLRRKHYFLPCQCHPSGNMVLRHPQPDDLLTPSYFCEATALGDGQVQVILEPKRTLKYRTGQTVHVVSGDEAECVIRLTSDPERDFVVTGTVARDHVSLLPVWMQPGAEFGYEFEIRGPFDERMPEELPYPPADPELWDLVDQGRIARSVFEKFYAKVYADEKLSPFFAHATMDRAIDKQFSFFKQCVTGEQMYMGDRPRNAHHWMIITHELFDHRQSLMRQTLVEHGFDEAFIARWTRFEEHFRPDMVKSSYWPRQIGDQLVMNDGFASEVVHESTLCDHCQSEVLAGSTVLYHRRLGTIACSACAESKEAGNSP